MNFNTILKKFYYNEEVLKFINNINTVGRGFKIIPPNTKPQPLSTLISFNFNKTGKIALFKIYCEIFRKFNNDEVLNFLPNADHFQKYFSFWDKKIHSSLCFGIKLNRKFEPIKYFHIKFGNNKKIAQEFFNLKIFDIIPYNNHELGISYEYKGNKFIEKKYVYFKAKNEIQKILKNFNLIENINIIDHIEYTSFNNSEKIIVVYKLENFKTPEYAYNLLRDKIKNTSKRCVCTFKTSFGLLPVYGGSYDNNIISLYWSLTNNKFLSPEIINTAY